MNIIELAKGAAKGGPPSVQLHNAMIAQAWTPFLERFAALVRAKAIEECAKRSDAYAYINPNLKVLSEELRGLK